MLFKFLAGLHDAVFQKSDRKIFLEVYMNWIHPQKPIKDKFLGFYRACEFNDIEEPIKSVEKKYIDKPLDIKKYKFFISHIKAMLFVMIKKSMDNATQYSSVSNDDKKTVLDEILSYIKSTEKNTLSLVKDYQEISPNYINIINAKCFGGNLNENTEKYFTRIFSEIEYKIMTLEDIS